MGEVRVLTIVRSGGAATARSQEGLLEEVMLEM